MKIYPKEDIKNLFGQIVYHKGREYRCEIFNYEYSTERMYIISSLTDNGWCFDFLRSSTDMVSSIHSIPIPATILEIGEKFFFEDEMRDEKINKLL